MATGAKKGLNPARKVGSAPDNKGLTAYTIASGYNTALGQGDPVKLVSGNLERGTNDTDDSVGVFQGVRYVDSTGNIVFNNYWPASTVATQIEALVLDDPSATFQAVADAAVTGVTAGEIYALTIADADASTKQSTMVVTVSGGPVAANLGQVKVMKVVDEANQVLEVILVDHAYRDNG